MRVADSAPGQGFIACELDLDDLRFSPSNLNLMAKINKPTSRVARVYISAVHGTDGQRAVGTGLDKLKMFLHNNKTLLTSFISAQHKPERTIVIEDKEYINELFTHITTIRTKTP
jgi:hypothetical protein